MRLVALPLAVSVTITGTGITRVVAVQASVIAKACSARLSVTVVPPGEVKIPLSVAVPVWRSHIVISPARSKWTKSCVQYPEPEARFRSLAIAIWWHVLCTRKKAKATAPEPKGGTVSRRAWILPDDGNPVEIHPLLIDHEEISSPLPLRHVDAGAPDGGFFPSDLYRRHEVVTGAAYLYLRDGLSLEEVPYETLDAIVHESVEPTAIEG